jgi:hypothetical protein
MSRAHAERSKRQASKSIDRWIASDYSQYIATSDMEMQDADYCRMDTRHL